MNLASHQVTRKLAASLYAVLLLITSLTVSAAVQPATLLLANVDHRTTLSLNGDWHAIVDPYDNGYYDFRMQPRNDGYFLNQRPSRSNNKLIEYDFANSPVLRVPGDWNSQRDTLFFYEGTTWYEREFNYQRKAN